MSEYGAVKGWKNRIRIGVSSAVNESIWKAGRDPLLNSFSVETGVDIEKISVIGSRQPVSIVEGVTEVSGSIERNLYSKNATYNEFIYVNDTTHYDLLKATGLGGTEGLECKILWNPVSDDVDDGYERVITNAKFHNYRIAHAARDIIAESVDYDASQLQIIKPGKQMITIIGINTTLNDYQVRIDLNSSNFNFKYVSDTSEICFTDKNGNSIPHWIESWSDDTATIWCRVPVIPANTSTHIWMMYGDVNTQSKSSGIATFDAFDYFDTAYSYEKLFDVVAVEPQEKYAGNPILHKGSSGTWEELGIRDNALLTDPYGNPVIENGHYILYYSGRNNDGGSAVGRATFDRPNVSTILNMTKESSNPVIRPSDLGWNDSTSRIMMGCVIKRGDNDYIAYLFGDNEAPWEYNIYYATSIDGISWTVNPSPILTVNDFEDGENLGLPNVKKIQYGANAGTWVMYMEHGANDIVFATSSDGLNWTPQNGGAPIITAADIPWAVRGPCNPKFLEVGNGKYIMGINGDLSGSSDWRGGFMKSTSLDSGWTDYGKFVLDVGTSGEFDELRIESVELFKSDFGGDLVGMMYFGCPTVTYQGCAIGYTTIDQTFKDCLMNWVRTDGVAINSSRYVSYPHSVKMDGASEYMEQGVDIDRFICEVSMRKETISDGAKFQLRLFRSDVTYGAYLEFGAAGDGDKLGWYNGSWLTLIHPYSSSQWYRIKIVKKGDNLYDVYVDGEKKLSDVTGADSMTTVEKIKFMTGTAISADNYVDSLIVRKYASPEPTVIV